MTSPENDSHLDSLIAVTRDLEAATDIEQLLHRLTSAATELTNSEAASILEFDESANALRFLAAPWFHKKPLMQITVPVDGSLAGWVYANSISLNISDVSKDPRHFKAVDQAINFTTSSLLAAPIIYKGNTIGVLEVVNKANNGHYTEEDVTFLEILTYFAAYAIWSAKLEKRILSAQNEIAELDRQKNNFIAITSHELRTPLGLILGHATYLKEMVSEEYQDAMDTIIRNATRLKEIVESVTEVDNYESGVARLRLNSISIPRVIEGVIESFKDMAIEKGINLQADTGNKDLLVEADENKIAVAISNVLRNAITFTDAGGKVTIKAESMPDYMQISVIDDGIGIPAKDLPRVFERFFQVESHLTRRYSGMGLGLAVAKTMIDLHGGRIWVESVEGEGSTFIILLPIKPKQINLTDKFLTP